jgi:hypothetical protein
MTIKTPKGAILELIMPNDLPISSTSLKSVTGTSKLTEAINFSINNQVIRMTNAVSEYYLASDRHSFNLALVQNPSSTKPTGEFKFNIYTSDEYFMYKLSTSITYKATAGKFSNVSIAQSNKEVNAVGNYIFSFNNGSPILANSILKITFPEQIKAQLISKSACEGVISGLSSSSECEVINITQNGLIKSELTIYNAFPQTRDSNTNLSFFMSKVTNFNCVKTSSSFVIASYTNENYLIDLTNSGIVLNFSEGSKHTAHLKIISVSKLKRFFFFDSISLLNLS